jgi:hypothetical protein
VWEVPSEGAEAERVRERLVAAGATPLFRYARAASQGWRVLSDRLPGADAREVPVTLEDALLATLQDRAPRAETPRPQPPPTGFPLPGPDSLQPEGV